MRTIPPIPTRALSCVYRFQESIRQSAARYTLDDNDPPQHQREPHLCHLEPLRQGQECSISQRGHWTLVQNDGWSEAGLLALANALQCLHWNYCVRRTRRPLRSSEYWWQNNPKPAFCRWYCWNRTTEQKLDELVRILDLLSTAYDMEVSASKTI